MIAAWRWRRIYLKALLTHKLPKVIGRLDPKISPVLREIHAFARFATLGLSQ
jgi:hypothetical protein